MGATVLDDLDELIAENRVLREEIGRLRKAVEVARTALLTIERRSEEMRAAITRAAADT